MHKSAMVMSWWLRNGFTCGAAVVLLALPSIGFAGELSVAWLPAQDPAVSGYRVFVGTEPGQYTRILDAGAGTKVVIPDLEDGRTHFVAVRPYDANGLETGVISEEIASLPKPRIEALDPVTLEGDSGFVTLHGANFDAEARVFSLDARLEVRSAIQTDGGGIVVQLARLDESVADDIDLTPAMFSVVNPGRKAEEFFVAHPEVMDIDNDHKIDEKDILCVRNAFGSRLGDPNYSLGADLDADGVVDGRDLARLVAKLGAKGADPASAP